VTKDSARPTARRKLALIIVTATEIACKALVNVRMVSWENCATCEDAQPTVLDMESATTALASVTKAGREKIALQRSALLSATTTELAPRMEHASVSLVTKVLPVPPRHARRTI